MRLPLTNPVTVLELLPRAVTAMDRVELLLDRAEAVLARAEKAVATAEDTNTRAQQVVERADTVSRQASRAVDGVRGISDRADAALQAWEPTLRKLAPQAKRFAESLAHQEVTAAITLVDRLPTLLEHVEQDVLPVLQNLDRVGPDLHDVLEVVEDLRRIITGLPGIGLLRRRAEGEPPPPIEGQLHDPEEHKPSR